MGDPGGDHDALRRDPVRRAAGPPPPAPALREREGANRRRAPALLRPLRARPGPLMRLFRSPTAALVVLTLINLLNYIDRYVIAAIQPRIKDALELSDGQLGA